MNVKLFLPLVLLAVFVTGCETIPPGVERGPHGTIAYDVLVESSESGVQVEADGESLGTTPLTLRIFGDKDGTFHDFGSYEYVVRAFPLNTNQFVQTRVFRTGRMFTPQDRIPSRIYFDMNQPPMMYLPPSYPPGYYSSPQPYYYHYYEPGIYYSPRIHVVPPIQRHHHRPFRRH